jgi:3-hydroxybutyryl-CoA dehydrogenase
VIVGIVGAGTMGAGIAQVALQAGHEVVLHDVDQRAIERARARIESGLTRLIEKGRFDPTLLTSTLARLRRAETLVAIAEEADVVVEAALEDLALKQTIFQALDSDAPPDTLLATNTSALSVTAIADATRRPQRVVGLHFFNPAPVMPLVEVVSTERTSRDALQAAVEFSEGLEKTPVVCRDAPGFIVNRVNRPFTLEALRMLESDEAGIADVDAAVTAAGYPMGPFQLMDLVGIDVNLAVARSLFEAFDHAERFRPSRIQEALVAAGRLGRKTGRGFYRYEGLERPAVDEAVAAEAGGGVGAPRSAAAAVHRLGEAEIVARIELAIVNEAYHAAGEEVATPPDIDRAMKLGANHPHGPFERARALGLRAVIEGLQRLERAHGERFRVAPALWQVAHV